MYSTTTYLTRGQRVGLTLISLVAIGLMVWLFAMAIHGARADEAPPQVAPHTYIIRAVITNADGSKQLLDISYAKDRFHWAEKKDCEKFFAESPLLMRDTQALLAQLKDKFGDDFKFKFFGCVDAVDTI